MDSYYAWSSSYQQHSTDVSGCAPEQVTDPADPFTPSPADAEGSSGDAAGQVTLELPVDLPSDIESWDLSWIVDSIRTATPWIVLLIMLIYLFWEVWNVYTDYYGCEQICRLRQEEDPYFKNPGEHLMNNLQGSKAILMESQKKKDPPIEKDKDFLEDPEVNELATKTTSRPEVHGFIGTGSRKLDFNDHSALLRLRKHKRKDEDAKKDKDTRAISAPTMLEKSCKKKKAWNKGVATRKEDLNQHEGLFRFSDEDEEDLKELDGVCRKWDRY